MGCCFIRNYLERGCSTWNISTFWPSRRYAYRQHALAECSITFGPVNCIKSSRSRIESTWYCVTFWWTINTGNTVWSDSSVERRRVYRSEVRENYAANVALPVVLVLDHVYQSPGRPTTGRGAASITTAASLSDSNSSRSLYPPVSLFLSQLPPPSVSVFGIALSRGKIGNRNAVIRTNVLFETRHVKSLLSYNILIALFSCSSDSELVVL